MSVIQLPLLPQAETTTPALFSNAVDATPTLGGPTQRLSRPGDRWQMSYKLRPMFYTQGVSLIAQLLQGLSGKVRAYIPQPGINTQVGNAVTFANAAATSGTTMALTGFPAGYTVQQGQFFNVSTGGVDYLYVSTSQQTATASGTATLSFLPILKAPPNSGDQVAFNAPVIEGFLQGNQQSWTLSLVQSVGITYTVKEAQ